MGAHPLKAALLTNMIPPYRRQLLEGLAADRAIDLHVYICQAVERDRHWHAGRPIKGVSTTTLRGWTLSVGNRKTPRYWHLRPDIFWRLMRRRPDVLILGDAGPTRWLALFASRLLAIPVALWSEDTLKRPPSAKTAWLWRLACRQARAFVAPGHAATQWLKHFGAAEDRVFLAPNCVDHDFYRRAARRLSGNRQALRRKLALPEDALIALFVGSLIDRKNPLSVLKAIAESDDPRWFAVLVGGGPLQPEIDREAERLGISERVRVVPFCPAARLCLYYAAADVFVLPSAVEPWGLVVNEAMCFGLPVIVSDGVAAGDDLVTAKNGYVLPAATSTGMAQALNALSDGNTRTKMGEHARTRIDAWTREREISGFRLAALRARNLPSKTGAT